jgi:hypothetical protein
VARTALQASAYAAKRMRSAPRSVVERSVCFPAMIRTAMLHACVEDRGPLQWWPSGLTMVWSSVVGQWCNWASPLVGRIQVQVQQVQQVQVQVQQVQVQQVHSRGEHTHIGCCLHQAVDIDRLSHSRLWGWPLRGTEEACEQPMVCLVEARVPTSVACMFCPDRTRGQ